MWIWNWGTMTCQPYVSLQYRSQRRRRTAAIALVWVAFLGYSFFLAPGKGPEAQAADQAWGTASQSRECCQQSADAAFGIRSTVPHDVHHWLMVTAQVNMSVISSWLSVGEHSRQNSPLMSHLYIRLALASVYISDRLDGHGWSWLWCNML